MFFDTRNPEEPNYPQAQPSTLSLNVEFEISNSTEINRNHVKNDTYQRNPARQHWKLVAYEIHGKYDADTF